METQVRTFTKFVKLGDSLNASAVVLSDTAGTTLPCNYIRVEASGTDADNALFVSYDPPGITNTLRDSGGGIDAFLSATGKSYSTSGFVGSVTQAVGGYPVELLLSDTDRTDTVYLQVLNTVGTIIAIVTYGQVQGGNIRRDNDRPVGS